MKRWQARVIYYPTLGYNYLLGRILKTRAWWNEVDEHLVLGAVPLRNDPKALAKMGVTGVVNTCDEFSGPLDLYAELGIEQLWIPTVDFNHPTREHVDRGADFIQRHADAGGKTYVHCKAGRARSATVALWWLVKYKGLTPEAAQQKLLDARPHINPAVYQRPVIVELSRELKPGGRTPAE
ncbi:MAG TPA: phosphatase [Planctomycetaceae bacterium]|nr:phosphatase [Planctomycetaceae bacterium]